MPPIVAQVHVVTREGQRQQISYSSARERERRGAPLLLCAEKRTNLVVCISVSAPKSLFHQLRVCMISIWYYEWNHWYDVLVLYRRYILRNRKWDMVMVWHGMVWWENWDDEMIIRSASYHITSKNMASKHTIWCVYHTTHHMILLWIIMQDVIWFDMKWCQLTDSHQAHHIIVTAVLPSCLFLHMLHILGYHMYDTGMLLLLCCWFSH